MSVDTELTRMAQNAASVNAAKSAIASAITAKGGTVGASDGLEDFSAAIAALPSGGGVSVRKWEGDIEYVNQTVDSAVIPIDTTGYDYVAVNLRIIETGVVSEGVVQYDEEPRAWASSAVIFAYNGNNFPDPNVKILRDATNYTSNTPDNCSYLHTVAGSNFSKNSIIGGISATGGGIVLASQNSGRKFARAGYYYKFHYTAYGIKEVIA